MHGIVATSFSYKHSLLCRSKLCEFVTFSCEATQVHTYTLPGSIHSLFNMYASKTLSVSF